MATENSIRVNWSIMGFILGAVGAVMTGLNTHYLVTKGGAEQMVNAALLKTRAGICVGQFNAAPNLQERIKEFKALNFLDRDAYIAKGGWDKMPGDEKATDGVNRVCGDRLAEMLEKQP